MKTSIKVFIALLSLLLCIGSSPAAIGENSGQKGVVSVYSTADLYPLALKWAGEFSRLHPDQQISVVKADPSALAETGENDTRIGFVSAKELSALKLAPKWQVIVGREVIVPIMNAANPFTEEINKSGISSKSFAASFGKSSGMQWGTLLNNGQTTPVHYYMVNDASVKSLLAGFLATDPGNLGTMTLVDGPEMVAAVQQDPAAIGFCRLTDLLAANAQGMAENIRLLPIDKNGNGKLDYMEQIYGDVQAFSRGVWIGKYPAALISDLFSVSSAAPTGETDVAFVSWVLTDGQQLLNQNGYCDLVANERQSQLDKITPANLTAVTPTRTISALTYILIGLAGFLVIGFLLNQVMRAVRNKQAASLTMESGPVVEFDERAIEAPKGLYFDKTHTWAFMEKDGTVRIGIDDFLKHTIGPVTRVEMKNPGEKIRKGDPLLTVIRQGKKLVLYSPVSGMIKKQNRELAASAALLHSSPFTDGWVYQVEPANWLREIQFLSMAEKYRSWINSEFTRLKDFLAMSLGTNNLQLSHVVLQDGGALKDGLLSELGPEVWEDFQHRFLDSAI